MSRRMINRVGAVLLAIVALAALAVGVWLVVTPPEHSGANERRVSQRRQGGQPRDTGDNNRHSAADDTASNTGNGSSGGNRPPTTTDTGSDGDGGTGGDGSSANQPAPDGATGRVIIEVVDPDGEPLAGVPVRLLADGADERTMATGPTGRAGFADVPLGTAMAVLDATDATGRDTAPLTVTAESVALVRLVRGPRVRLRGRVLDRDGNPVPHATVTAAIIADPDDPAGRIQAQAACEADGSYELTAPVLATGREMRLTAAAPGVVTATHTAPAETTEWNPVLHPLTTGRLRLTAPDGQPVTKGTVHLQRVGGDPADPADRRQVSLTADWQWPELAAGEWVVLVETPTGSWSGTVTAPTDTADDLDLPLQPSATLPVQVVDAAGVPVANAHVLVHRTDLAGVEWRQQADATGTVRFVAIPPGPVRVVATAPTGRPRATQDLVLTGGLQPLLRIELP